MSIILIFYDIRYGFQPKLRQLDPKVATALRVPLVCARETHENDQTVIETMYSAPSESFTKKKKLVLYVTKDRNSRKELTSDER